MTRRKRQRRTSEKNALPPEPLYKWAFNVTGEPVHIVQAVRGVTYACPLCQDKMVAKMGDIQQHHFAHEHLRSCTPSQVARVVAGKWIATRIQACLAARQPLMMTWPCPLCQQKHTANLLHAITSLRQGHSHHDLQSEIALLDEAGQVRAVVVFGPLSRTDLATYIQHAITVIVVDLTRRHEREAIPTLDLLALLAGAAIYGGVCRTQQIAAQHQIVTDPAALRGLFIAAVTGSSPVIYGALEDYEGLTHVFTLDAQRLWLPPILWQRAIGGLHHAIHPALQIISQEWPQEDEATIALYYITAQDTYAVAVRRFPPGKPPYARLDMSVFRPGNFNAVSIARGFSEL